MTQKTVTLTDPKPLPVETRCPVCRADQSKRVPSGAFGALHDVCGKCGYDFEEWTLGTDR